MKYFYARLLWPDIGPGTLSLVLYESPYDLRPIC